MGLWQSLLTHNFVQAQKVMAYLIDDSGDRLALVHNAHHCRDVFKQILAELLRYGAAHGGHASRTCAADT